MSDVARGYLRVQLPSRRALAWIGKLVRLAWLPFVLAIVGRWFAATLEVVSSALLAYSLVQLGGTGETGLPIPDAVMRWIRASQKPLLATLLFALAVVVVAQLTRTLVQWCLTWIHLDVNRRVTPEVIDASIEPATRRLLDPPTAVQRWLLKIDVSYFIYESVAESIGDVGTIVIILIATLRTNASAGEAALAGLFLWTLGAIPLTLRALRASRKSAEEHETVGRVIRDGAALRGELGRPSLRAYWHERHRSALGNLQRAIRLQGIWNAALFGVLGLIAFGLPIAAVIAAASSGSVASALAVLLYLTRMATPLDSLVNTLPWIQQNLISVQRLYEVVELDRDRIDAIPKQYSPSEIQIRNWAVPLPNGARIQYPDLTARRGAILLVAGASGSGKSSLLASLAGQRAATGVLLIGAADLSPSDPGWLETCAYVPQEPELVPGLLRDNLDDFPGWNETPALARAAAAVLATRRDGDEGTVAIDEKGVSTGQRRAIAVLRALGSSATVLLLDEPVTGVDDRLLAPIRDALLEAVDAGKLLVIAAHRHDVDRLAFGAAATVVHLNDDARSPVSLAAL